MRKNRKQKKRKEIHSYLKNATQPHQFVAPELLFIDRIKAVHQQLPSLCTGSTGLWSQLARQEVFSPKGPTEQLLQCHRTFNAHNQIVHTF